MNGIKAIIVIYNKRLADTPAFKSIRGCEAVGIFIADNSTKDFGNEMAARQIGAHYFSMGGNLGLSRAYNRIIAEIEKNEDVICIFDDDTTIGSDYFRVLQDDMDKYKDIEVLAPIVKDTKGILSPCIFRSIKGRRVKRLEDLPQKGISVVNSGLAVRAKAFAAHRFDEGLFLDFIDHSFIRDVTGGDGARIRVMDTVVEQQFSGSGEQGFKADIKRYRILKKDAMYFCSKYGISKIKCRLFLFSRKAAIFIKDIIRVFRS